ncbi:MAG: cell division protein ZapA [Fibrobacterales bacterium]|nr:cell division protein ZapA [Fibrobacterales bacterium]
MVEPETTLRSQKITLCGQTFPIRTDLTVEALDELVRQAQEKLDRLGVRPPIDDPQRLLLPFLVVCGELQETQKKVEELKESARQAETFAQKLAQLLEISDIG